MNIIGTSNFSSPFKAVSAVDFGNAWAVGTRECLQDTGEAACPEGSQRKVEAINLCSILTSVVGNFLLNIILN